MIDDTGTENNSNNSKNKNNNNICLNVRIPNRVRKKRKEVGRERGQSRNFLGKKGARTILDLVTPNVSSPVTRLVAANQSIGFLLLVHFLLILHDYVQGFRLHFYVHKPNIIIIIMHVRINDVIPRSFLSDPQSCHLLPHSCLAVRQ